jgi:hypothetical protein
MPPYTHSPYTNQSRLVVQFIPGQQICVLLAFYHHIGMVKKESIDICEVTNEAFNIFKMSMYWYSPKEATVPFRNAESFA